jgi:uncharacterized protein (TIGR00730 family)
MLYDSAWEMSHPAKVPMAAIRSICVYCGSGFGSDPLFVQSAAELGRAMGERGINLVYGGGNVGLMGTVARAVLDNGGHVTGIIPEFLKAREKMLDDVQETIVVSDMHTRKRIMFERADAFVAMPGGIGTLEELVEQMTWSQLGRHTKPILLLSTKGFWKPLLTLIAHMREQGFIRPGLELNYLVAETVDEVIPMLEASARRIGLSANAELIERRF